MSTFLFVKSFTLIDFYLRLRSPLRPSSIRIILICHKAILFVRILSFRPKRSFIQTAEHHIISSIECIHTVIWKAHMDSKIMYHNKFKSQNII